MKYLNHFFISIGIALLFFSCDTKQDVAPVPTYPGKANMTIAELLALHEIGDSDSHDTIPAGTVITGIVTTSDEWGNNYKSINIEDETGGIMIKINNTALYNKFKVGQRVYVNCTGLSIGDYRKLPQIGIWYNGSMENIPNNKIYLYIFNDGMPQPIEPSIVLSSIPAADNIPSTYYNRLVRLEGARFVEAGAATFADPNAATSHDIAMSDGTTITLRTSNYAKFASAMLPTGTGNITGILTRYNSTVQLVISSLDDLEDFSTPQTLQTIFTVNYPNAFNEGWFQVSDDNLWGTMTNSSFSGFYIDASDSKNWLVSPSINLAEANNAVLDFFHRAPKGFNSTELSCYYTTNYTGDVNTTQWHPITLSADNGFTTPKEEVFEIPEDAHTSGFRIAFIANNNKSKWYLYDIRISALVN